MPRGVRRIITIPKDPVKLAYLAGIVDGEGCVRIHVQLLRKARSPCHHVELVIINTNDALIAWLLREIGGYVYTRRKEQPHHKTSMCWIVTSTNAENLLAALFPYLTVKKPQAALVAEFVEIGKHEWCGGRLDPRIVEKRAEVKTKIQLANSGG